MSRPTSYSDRMESADYALELEKAGAETCTGCGAAFVPCHTCTVRVGRRFEKRIICRDCEDSEVWRETVAGWNSAAHEQGYPCECGHASRTINGTCVTCGGFEDV